MNKVHILKIPPQSSAEMKREKVKTVGSAYSKFRNEGLFE
jgi:hypothetical protein